MKKRKERPKRIEFGQVAAEQLNEPNQKKRKDEYSRILLENHMEKEENAKIDENGNKSLPDDFDVWKGVATSEVNFLFVKF
nr:hypothetical protein [Tanacetum cinerariifolium]